MQVGLFLMLLVGGLQMFRVRAGFLTNYAGDVAGPVFLYGAIRQRKTVLRYFSTRTPSPEFTAVSLFLACAAWEICQLLDLRGTPLDITRGRFDVFDLLTYAASLVVCYAADTRVRKRSRLLA
jgi:hypothetical protein